MSHYKHNSRDMDIEVSIECENDILSGWPNQGDLHKAIGDLLRCFQNWDRVRVTVRKESLFANVEGETS